MVVPSVKIVRDQNKIELRHTASSYCIVFPDCGRNSRRIPPCASWSIPALWYNVFRSYKLARMEVHCCISTLISQVISFLAWCLPPTRAY